MEEVTLSSPRWLSLRELRRLVERYYQAKGKDSDSEEKTKQAFQKINSKIKDLGDSYQFLWDKNNKDPPKFKKTTVTAYKINAAKPECYTLESLVHFVQHINENWSISFKKALEAKLQPVRFTEKQGLLRYLRGVDNAKQAKDPTYQNPNVIYPVSQGSKKKSLDGNKDGKVEKSAKKQKKGSKNFWEDHEQPLSTLNSILDCSESQIADICRPIWDSFLKSKSQQQKPQLKAKEKYGMPIIIVPAASTSAIGLYNVKEFLEHGVFVPNDEAKSKHKTMLSQVIIERKKPSTGEIQRYKVVNSVRGFKSDKDWKRVVAAFVFGPEYQFKGWKWKSPSEIFDNCQGLHVYFDDVKLNLNVKAWNVKVFELRKQSRNKDRIQSHRIWEEIDSFIFNKKRYLEE
mmetsp:Transcript_8640/g.9844  ORF Transcript_8640/g.9844 Transcript_8640/m.9844 type:complete len:401 (-) Transcript_8640:191-1393(-)